MKTKAKAKSEGRRLGKFYIGLGAVDEKDFIKVLSDLKFIPYRVECLAHRDAFEYIGTSCLFEECKDGEKPPLYDVRVQSEDGKYKKVYAIKICDYSESVLGMAKE